MAVHLAAVQLEKFRQPCCGFLQFAWQRCLSYVPLDLDRVVAAVYQRGAYDRLIDYSQAAPPPPFSEAETDWMHDHLHAQGV